jgi:hypothetical protein
VLRCVLVVVWQSKILCLTNVDRFLILNKSRSRKKKVGPGTCSVQQGLVEPEIRNGPAARSSLLKPHTRTVKKIHRLPHCLARGFVILCLRCTGTPYRVPVCWSPCLLAGLCLVRSHYWVFCVDFFHQVGFNYHRASHALFQVWNTEHAFTPNQLLEGQE